MFKTIFIMNNFHAEHVDIQFDYDMYMKTRCNQLCIVFLFSFAGSLVATWW